MTQEELQAIKERAEKATPGPWEASHTWICDGESYYVSVTSGRSLMDSYVSLSDADAEFVAAARTDVPALVAALESVPIRPILDLMWWAQGYAKGDVEPMVRKGIMRTVAQVDEWLKQQPGYTEAIE